MASSSGRGAAHARGRRLRPRAAAASRRNTESLIKDFLDSANALAQHARDLEGELQTAKRDSDAYAQIQKLIGGR